MSKVRLPFGVILAAIFIVCVTNSLNLAADDTAAKQQAMQQTGKQLLDVASEQYQRGMYEDARATVRKVEPFRNYLSKSDLNRLDELTKSLDIKPDSGEVNQPVAQNIAAELLSQARNLSAPGQYAQAKDKYLQAKQSGQLSAQELSAVDAELAALEQASQMQQTQSQQSGVNPEYIKFVPSDVNDINNACQAAVPCDKNKTCQAVIPAAAAQHPVVEEKPVTVPPTAEQVKENYIEVVKQKQRIQQSYTKAVVNEAVAKAKEYADKDEFARAKDEISRANAVVEKNKLLLGEEDYKQYTTTLQQLSTEIAARQTEIERQKAEKAKAEAQASQENLRAQQIADKQKRIQDLLSRAREYQEQQKYEEALAQIETLLAIDPTNREGAINKQMLLDIINLRTQLEIKREIGRQEEAVFTDTQRSMIPHAELMTFPRNWQDISAKRKANVISGLSEADSDVYKQLETKVDLSALTPDTPFNEAIEIIRNSVDPPLKIVVLWRDLADNAYIEQDVVIGMQGFTGVPLGEALKMLLTAVSGGVANIDFAVNEGIITIATKESLPSSKLVTQVYDVSEIIGASANFEEQQTETGSGGGDGSISSSASTSSEDTEGIVEENVDDITLIIQDTVEPDTWLVNGGEGTINRTNDYRLIITQSPQVHLKIQKLIDDLRESKGQQVAIEARFLFVTENFLEDIGIDTDIKISQFGNLTDDIYVNQSSYSLAAAGQTSVPGSLAGTASTIAGNSSGTSGIGLSLFADDLQISFLMRATQAHRDAKTLTAPRVTVLSGERANISLLKNSTYVSDYEFEDITSSGDNAVTRTVANPTEEWITGGVNLNVTPTISADKKYVILLITANYTQINLDTQWPVYSSTTGEEYTMTLPTSEVADIRTRVSVPDGGTLLIGGQKLGAEVNKEAGVPGFSKVPLIGRLFSNRSKVKDQEVLLILVKPSIIIQKEAEQEYLAPLEEK